MAIQQAARKRVDLMQKLFPFPWISIYPEIVCERFFASSDVTHELTRAAFLFRMAQKKSIYKI